MSKTTSLKVLIPTSFILLVAIAFFLQSTSCSKARVQPNTLNSYSSVNNYFSSKQQPEQVDTIKGPGPGPIIGLLGTKIWGSKQCLTFPNGDSVSYPFVIKLVELYSPKDMIYYQMPTVAGGTILKTDGEIRLRAFKGSTELILKPNPCMFQIEMPCVAPQVGKSAYYGITTNSEPDWALSNPLVPFTTNVASYTAYITKLGWINCGQTAPGASNISLSFTSTTDDLTNVGIFVYLPSTKTVVQVYNQQTNVIPAGSNAKIIAIGVNGSGNLFYWYQQATLTSSSNYSISLASTTDAALTTLLNGL